MNALSEMLGTLRDLAVLMQPQGLSPTGGVAGLDWRVCIVDTTGAAVSVGGGTQYADGATQANPTGNVTLWLDTSNVIRAASATKPLPVNIVTGSSSQVDASAWTTASTSFSPGGGVFNDSAAALTSGQQGTQRLTAARGAHVNLRTTAGADAWLTNNGAAPAAFTNLGVLPVLANAAAPSWTEGRIVTLSSDLAGNLRALAGLVAGSATAGNVGGMEAFPTATFTRPADTTAYAANDAICNSTTVPAAMSFANAALRSGGGGFVMGAAVLDEANQTTKLNATLHLFSAVPGTLTNDNAPMTFANADMANWQGALRYTSTAVTNTASGASGSVMLFAPQGGSFPYKCAATSLFGVLQADNAYTPVSAEVFVVTLQLSQDA